MMNLTALDRNNHYSTEKLNSLVLLLLLFLIH